MRLSIPFTGHPSAPPPQVRLSPLLNVCSTLNSCSQEKPCSSPPASKAYWKHSPSPRLCSLLSLSTYDPPPPPNRRPSEREMALAIRPVLSPPTDNSRASPLRTPVPKPGPPCPLPHDLPSRGLGGIQHPHTAVASRGCAPPPPVPTETAASPTCGRRAARLLLRGRRTHLKDEVPRHEAVGALGRTVVLHLGHEHPMQVPTT